MSGMRVARRHTDTGTNHQKPLLALPSPFHSIISIRLIILINIYELITRWLGTVLNAASRNKYARRTRKKKLKKLRNEAEEKRKRCVKISEVSKPESSLLHTPSQRGGKPTPSSQGHRAPGSLMKKTLIASTHTEHFPSATGLALPASQVTT